MYPRAPGCGRPGDCRDRSAGHPSHGGGRSARWRQGETLRGGRRTSSKVLRMASFGDPQWRRENGLGLFRLGQQDRQSWQIAIPFKQGGPATDPDDGPGEQVPHRVVNGSAVGIQKMRSAVVVAREMILLNAIGGDAADVALRV